MEFAAVAEEVAGVPFATREQGQTLYEHIISTRPAAILELGTAHGVSCAYMAAALDEIGAGRITTLDRTRADYQPGPEEVLAKAGVSSYVDLVRTDDSSYTWYLKRQVEAQSDDAGNCAPVFDFCYLDGAHDWTIDGFAAVLVEKLLRPGGWLLLDDMSWTNEFAEIKRSDLSADERTAPHIRAVFDLIVRQMPSFTEFRVDEDLDWGWARKQPGAPRVLTLQTRRSIGSVIAGQGRRVTRRLLGHR